MVTVVTREANGIPLTHDQVDDNFTGLADAINNIGEDILAPAVAAKDAAIAAAGEAQTSALNSANSADAASISRGNAETSAEASATSASASSASASLSASYVTDLFSSAGTTFIGFMADGIGAVVRRLFDKLLETISTKDYGAVADGVTNDAAAIVKANTKAGKRPLVFIGVSHVGTPTTITAPISDTMEQIFSVTSQVTIDNGRPIRPEWFGATGGNILRAIAATPANGGVIQLENATYPPQGISYGFGSAGSLISKKGIKIEGKKMPTLALDCRSLVGGTIIQGMFGAYADDFSVSNLGIDNGFAAINTYAGGVVSPGLSEGFFCSYPDNATKAASPLRRGLRLHNIVSLVFSPTAPVHAIIAGEGYSDIACTGEIIGCFGTHGIVFKGAQVTADQLTAYGNGGEGVILKSDAQATSVSDGFQIGRISTHAGGPKGWSPYAVATTGSGVMFNAELNSVYMCQIGSVFDYGHPLGVSTNLQTGFVLDNLQIGCITGESNSVATVAMTAPASSGVLRVSIGEISSRNSGSGLIAEWASSVGGEGVLSINSLSAINCGVALDCGGVVGVVISEVAAASCSSGAIRVRGSARPLIGTIALLNGTSMYATDSGGTAPTLASGWSQVAVSELFSATLIGFNLALGGLVKPGTGGIIAQLPFFAWPATPKRVISQGYNGISISPVPLVINASGQIIANEVAGGFANCTTWLSLSGINYNIAT